MKSMNVSPVVEITGSASRRPSSTMDMLPWSRSDRVKKKCLTCKAGVRLTAFQTCTWALVMQEDCLEI
jgi:hypothetical protein